MCIRDRSIDNLNRYLAHAAKDDTYQIINNIIEKIDSDVVQYAKTMRNNLHYNIQIFNFEICKIKEIYKLLLKECAQLPVSYTHLDVYKRQVLQ